MYDLSTSISCTPEEALNIVRNMSLEQWRQYPNGFHIPHMKRNTDIARDICIHHIKGFGIATLHTNAYRGYLGRVLYVGEFGTITMSCNSGYKRIDCIRQVVDISLRRNSRIRKMMESDERNIAYLNDGEIGLYSGMENIAARENTKLAELLDEGIHPIVLLVIYEGTGKRMFMPGIIRFTRYTIDVDGYRFFFEHA
jgi:hypothetical protein